PLGSGSVRGPGPARLPARRERGAGGPDPVRDPHLRLARGVGEPHRLPRRGPGPPVRAARRGRRAGRAARHPLGAAGPPGRRLAAPGRAAAALISSPPMTDALQLPTVAVAVDVARAEGAVVRAQLCGPDRARPERTALAVDVAARLDGDPPFVPARDAGGHVVLYAKQALAYVAVALHEASRDS